MEKIAVLNAPALTRRQKMSDAQIAAAFQEIIDADMLDALPVHFAQFAQALASMGMVRAKVAT